MFFFVLRNAGVRISMMYLIGQRNSPGIAGGSAGGAARCSGARTAGRRGGCAPGTAARSGEQKSETAGKEGGGLETKRRSSQRHICSKQIARQPFFLFFFFFPFFFIFVWGQELEEIPKAIKRKEKAVRQIEDLKDLAAGGKALNEDQRQKVAKESELRGEIAALVARQAALLSGAADADVSATAAASASAAAAVKKQ